MQVIVGRTLLLTPLVVLLAHYGWRFFIVDDCLDMGGAFDYARNICVSEGEGSLPYVPYSRQFSLFWKAALGVSLAGLVILIFKSRRPSVV